MATSQTKDENLPATAFHTWLPTHILFTLELTNIYVGVGNRFDTPTHIGLFSIDGTSKKGDFFYHL
jgi:hypothetical protein